MVVILQLVLFLIGIIIFLPKHLLKQPFKTSFTNIIHQLPWFFIIIAVVTVHLIEVNVIDHLATMMVGTDIAVLFTSIEDSVVANIHIYWNIFLLAFFVIMYIVVYPFILWFSTLYFLLDDQKRSLQSLAIGLLCLYLISLPFYLFFPVSNVYTANNLDSALSMIFPSINSFFYVTTTSNNCFPSLHVGMSILIAWSVKQSNNRRFYLFALFSMVSVIISVMYLAIHWIIDVIGGIIVASAAMIISSALLKRFSSYDSISRN
ncbi:MAG: phosphatase PAP2 family protein [Thermoplasmatota archaeon]